MSMVRDYAQNVDVILGDGGLLSAKPKNMTNIVMSTLDPDTMNELGQRAEEQGDVKLIAAVSGGAIGAQAGTLSIMTSGPEDCVRAARPYFDAVGSNVFSYGSQPLSRSGPRTPPWRCCSRTAEGRAPQGPRAQRRHALQCPVLPPTVQLHGKRKTPSQIVEPRCTA